MTTLLVSELSQTTLDGTGVFDVLMRANKTHLDAEYAKNRIKGAEYATVYLGSLQSVLQTSLAFVLQQRKNDLEATLLEKQIALVTQQGLNAVTEGLVLTAQKCKLDAEFDLLQSEKLKSISETALLTQKNATEKAQTMALGVDADSVVGRQKELYVAQAKGFKRDAEQKAAKLLIDTWNVRKTTDDTEVAIITDATIVSTVNTMISGLSQ